MYCIIITTINIMTLMIQQDSVGDERVTSSHFKTSTVGGKKVTFVITSCR